MAALHILLTQQQNSSVVGCCFLCECSTFKQATQSQRYCENCCHSWTWHVTSIMNCIQSEAPPALHVLLRDVISLVLHGTTAISHDLKLLVDGLIDYYFSGNANFILSYFGWHLVDYNRRYKLQDQLGNPIIKWIQPLQEELSLIIKQFCKFPPTNLLALQLLQNNLSNSTIPFGIDSNTTTDNNNSLMTINGKPYISLSTLTTAIFTNSLVPLNLSNSSRIPPNESTAGSSDKLNTCQNDSELLQTDSLQFGDTVKSNSAEETDPSTTQTMDNLVSFTEDNKLQRFRKRAICRICNKSFYDNGALKVHTSSVHLGEKHKCLIPGCNVWFNSKRSRNRHSANPNPRLHQNGLASFCQGKVKDESNVFNLSKSFVSSEESNFNKSTPIKSSKKVELFTVSSLSQPETKVSQLTEKK